MSAGNPPTQKQYRVTPEQVTGLALLDNASAMMQFSANQMGGHFQQKDLGEFFSQLADQIQVQKLKFLEAWNNKVQLVGADALPPAPKVH